MHLQRNQTIGSSRIINSEPTSGIYPWMIIVATLYSIPSDDKTNFCEILITLKVLQLAVIKAVFEIPTLLQIFPQTIHVSCG